MIAEIGWWVCQLLFWLLAIMGAFILLIGLIVIGIRFIQSLWTADYTPRSKR